MKIDLNDLDNISLEAVRELIRSKDDSVHRQLRISDEGLAYLSDDVGNSNLEGVSARYETWNEGNGYCGDDAANDDQWVRRVTEWLRADWPTGVRGYIAISKYDL